MRSPKDLYIITTAKKRDSKEWLGELVPFLLYPGDDGKTRFGNKIVVDSWNNIGKYVDAEDSYFCWMSSVSFHMEHGPNHF